MTDYGGLGGIWGGRPINVLDEFELAVERCLGRRLRQEPDLCARLWGSLANVEWEHKRQGHTAGYSFRAAGDLIAAVVGKGDYMDWYCSAPEGVVDWEVEQALAREGWTPQE